MLNVKKLTMWYSTGKSKKKVLNDISCMLESGRITTFIGKSGAGKSSLFSCFAQLQHYEGLITFNQKPIQELSSVERVSAVGFIDQQFNLFSNLTCLTNCTQPLRVVLKISQEEAYEKAMSFFKLLEIDEIAQSYPSQLSGGQQQRVAIARALCFNPKVLLFDEPTSALDPEMSAQIAKIIQEIAQKNVAVGIITHDVSFINAIFDRIYFMKDGVIIESFDKQVNVLEDTIHIRSFLKV